MSLALLMALVATERRETIVIDLGNATLNLPTTGRPKPRNLCGGTGETYDPMAHDGWIGTPCPGCEGCNEPRVEPEVKPMPESILRNLGNMHIGTAEISFGKPSRGRVVEQAKGPNRAADRARGIYGKRGRK